jgi:hypothetical protein
MILKVKVNKAMKQHDSQTHDYWGGRKLIVAAGKK